MNGFKGGFGGGGGGGFNMQNLMKQAQKMQEDLAKAQEELEKEEVIASVGGGMVEVVMNGKKQLKSIKLNKQAVDPDEVEMLEDLIMAAFNDAQTKAEKLYSEKMPNGMNGLM